MRTALQQSDVLAALIVLTGGLSTAAASFAQTFPSKPIRFVVPYPPGGTTDSMARLFQKWLAWQQPIIVENRGGGDGVIGTELVTRSNPDGHTFILNAPGPISTLPVLKKVPYDPMKDLRPVVLLAITPSLLAVHPSVPAKSVKELVMVAKAKPSQFNYASTGNGAPSHLMGVLFGRVADIDIVHVPYKGSGAALSDLIGGHIQMMFNTTTAILPAVRSGRLRALAITGGKRFTPLPDVPTMGEAGFPTIESSGWYGIFVPARVPERIVTEINERFVQALNSPDIQAALQNDGATIIGNTPAEFAQFIRTYTDKWTKVIRDAGIRAE